jgi:hypothetical protein
MLAGQRYLLVFDNFESVLALGESGLDTPAAKSAAGYSTGGETLLALFSGLLAARWRGTLLFTSRFPWPALDEHLGRSTALALELNDLTARQAIMLMDNLPRLRREKLETKIAVYKKVGGHPKSLELLEGWLASGRITDLLDDPNLDGLLREAWENYFLKALLAQLPPADRARLEEFEQKVGWLSQYMRSSPQFDAGAAVALFLSSMAKSIDAMPGMYAEMQAMNAKMNAMPVLANEVAGMNAKMSVIAANMDSTMGRAGRMMPWGW